MLNTLNTGDEFDLWEQPVKLDDASDAYANDDDESEDGESEDELK